jgi:hypothetical protein
MSTGLNKLVELVGESIVNNMTSLELANAKRADNICIEDLFIKINELVRNLYPHATNIKIFLQYNPWTFSTTGRNGLKAKKDIVGNSWCALFEYETTREIIKYKSPTLGLTPNHALSLLIEHLENK